MKQWFGRILQHYGSAVQIRHADGVETVRAFLQPVTEHGWETVRRVLRGIGEVPRGRYVYIGPEGILPKEDTVMVCGGRRYRVCCAERLCCADEAVYVWALLRAAGGDDGAAGG